MKSYRHFLLFILLCTFTCLAAQDRMQLEEKRMQVIESIETTDSLILASESDRQKGIATLVLLRGQISQRNELLNNIKKSILAAELEIENNQLSLDNLKDKVSSIETQYAELIRSKYVKKLTGSKWITILSASNINEAFLRWNYHRQFDSYRKSKINELSRIKGIIAKKNEEIKKFALENSALIQEQELQNSEQQIRIEQQNELLRELQKDKTILQSQLTAIKQERESLNQAIESRVLGALSGVRETSEIVTNNTESLVIKKGHVMLPISNGYIEDISVDQEVRSETISIFAFEGSDVLSVAPGEVISIKSMDGYGKMIILQHGDYYSIYANMLDVIVKKGDRVDKSTILGNVDSEQNRLHFELWKDKERLSAREWMSK